MSINGQVPGPLLRFREGQDVVIHVRNTTRETTSIHWHGFLIPAAMDGVPGFNGFPGIAPGESFTYRFRVRQHGTYWYHSHSSLQEQRGLYGPIIIDPATPEPDAAQRDYVVFLSDVPRDEPEIILNRLKTHPGYYNFHRRTVGDFARDAHTFGLGATLQDRLSWGAMRMDATDLSDVAGYTFMINGRPPETSQTLIFNPGERVRLRLINGGAMSLFDLRVPGLKLTVVGADGRAVDPVEIDELRIGPGETYDLIVAPTGDQAFAVYAESIDRTGYALATLAPQDGMRAPVPPMRPRAVLTMNDMGMSGDMPGMSMSGGHDMAGMDNGQMSEMSGMSHDMGAGLGMNGGVDGSGRTFGWGSEFPAEARVLNYADLRSLAPHAEAPAPTREIAMRLGGNMERYIWTINGETTERAQPIAVRYGERVRITFTNETMMAHPMHLHGMFVQLDNGQPADRLPDKHTIIIPPGQSVSAFLTADEVGQWAFHCHLFFHMATGMMTSLLVSNADGAPQPASMADHGDHH
ncbi:MAG TPA: multicopper oxidase domain-containing protein [Caulobacterales bacterium]|nr:multicopper oxidase domain-containing protein [Caulobacterales bacterium]